jgi:hypothetical protein
LQLSPSVNISGYFLARACRTNYLCRFAGQLANRYDYAGWHFALTFNTQTLLKQILLIHLSFYSGHIEEEAPAKILSRIASCMLELSKPTPPVVVVVCGFATGPSKNSGEWLHICRTDQFMRDAIVCGSVCHGMANWLSV